jgi:hypothetical protein
MLGNLAEALLTLVMLLVVPAGLALIILLVLRLAKGHDARDRTGRADEVNATQPPAVVYVILSILAGGALGFISLEMFYGIVLAVATGVLLFRQARGRGWLAIGGFMLGMGLCAAGFLSRALTNHDPAVTYDASTIPVFWVANVLALCGAVTLAAATTATRRRRLLP